MHFTSAIHNTAFTIVLGYVELCAGTGDSNFQKKQYIDLCKVCGKVKCEFNGFQIEISQSFKEYNVLNILKWIIFSRRMCHRKYLLHVWWTYAKHFGRI